jgi:hypothetical protein
MDRCGQIGQSRRFKEQVDGDFTPALLFKLQENQDCRNRISTDFKKALQIADGAIKVEHIAPDGGQDVANGLG